MLAYYSKRLNGVELNNSFYKVPTSAALAAWLNSTGPAFRFCLKAHRGLTYSGPGFDRAGLAGLFGARVGELGDRAGPVLLQFPPGRTLDAALLEALLDRLGVRAAVEFRHRSWFVPEVDGIVHRHRGTVVVTDDEGWPMAPYQRGPSIAYFRLRRDYSAAALDSWRETIARALEEHEEVHVYFKHEAAGPRHALRVLELSSPSRSSE